MSGYHFTADGHFREAPIPHFHGIQVHFHPFMVEDLIMRINGILYAKDLESAMNLIDWQNEINRLWPDKVAA